MWRRCVPFVIKEGCSDVGGERLHREGPKNGVASRVGPVGGGIIEAAYKVADSGVQRREGLGLPMRVEENAKRGVVGSNKVLSRGWQESYEMKKERKSMAYVSDAPASFGCRCCYL
jgi:hypothetical protein